MTHIPYTGAGGVVALLGGQVDAVAFWPATAAAHEGGKLGVATGAPPGWKATRGALAQAVGLRRRVRAMVRRVRSRGTPEPIVQRLRAAARANDEGQGSHHECRQPVLYQDTPDFEKYVQNDVRRMADVVKKIGKVQ